jgi:hypothetical protein
MIALTMESRPRAARFDDTRELWDRDGIAMIRLTGMPRIRISSLLVILTD